MGFWNDIGYYTKNIFAIEDRREEVNENMAGKMLREMELQAKKDQALEQRNKANGGAAFKFLKGLLGAAALAAVGVAVLAVAPAGIPAMLVGSAFIVGGGFKAFGDTQSYGRDLRQVEISYLQQEQEIKNERSRFEVELKEGREKFSKEVFDNKNYVILNNKYSSETTVGRQINPRNPLALFLREGVDMNGRVAYQVKADIILGTFSRFNQDEGNKKFLGEKLQQLLHSVDNTALKNRIDHHRDAMNAKIGISSFANGGFEELMANAAQTAEMARQGQNMLSLALENGERLNVSLDVLVGNTLPAAGASSERAVEAAVLNYVAEKYFNRSTTLANDGGTEPIDALLRDFSNGELKLESGDPAVDAVIAKCLKSTVGELYKATKEPNSNKDSTLLLDDYLKIQAPLYHAEREERYTQIAGRYKEFSDDPKEAMEYLQEQCKMLRDNYGYQPQTIAQFINKLKEDAPTFSGSKFNINSSNDNKPDPVGQALEEMRRQLEASSGRA